MMLSCDLAGTVQRMKTIRHYSLGRTGLKEIYSVVLMIGLRDGGGIDDRVSI